MDIHNTTGRRTNGWSYPADRDFCWVILIWTWEHTDQFSLGVIRKWHQLKSLGHFTKKTEDWLGARLSFISQNTSHASGIPWRHVPCSRGHHFVKLDAGDPRSVSIQTWSKVVSVFFSCGHRLLISKVCWKMQTFSLRYKETPCFPSFYLIYLLSSPLPPLLSTPSYSITPDLFLLKNNQATIRSHAPASTRGGRVLVLRRFPRPHHGSQIPLRVNEL